MKGCMWLNTIVLNLIFFLMMYLASSHTALHFRRDQSNSEHNITANSMETEINNYIYSFNYNPEEALVYKGKSGTNVKAEGHFNEYEEFIVINPEHKTISIQRAKIGVISSNEQITYPGSLLLANYHLIDNNPDYLDIERAPILTKVYVTGIMGSVGGFTKVPTFTNYKTAVNDILKNWFKKYSDTHTLSTDHQSDFSFAYSKEQLRVKFGLAFKDSAIELNTDFSAVDKQEKLIMIQRFQPEFYTVSVESPYSPTMLFGKGVTRAEVASKCNDNNPPLMVNSVFYGRVIYVKIETTSTDKKAKTLMEKELNNILNAAEVEIDYTKQLRNFDMQVFVMAGAGGQIDQINTKNLTVASEVIARFFKFTSDNLGYPISYTAEFIKDNKGAVVKSTAEYVEVTRTVRDKGFITLEHTGWYVAQWRVFWNEVSYDGNGKKLVVRKGWDKNGKSLTAPFKESIFLKGNCESISVQARECTGLFWDWWRTVFHRVGIELNTDRKFSIWGITLNPQYSIESVL